MPRFDLEKHGKALQLGVSTFNALMLAGGMLWFVAIWYGDTKTSGVTQSRQLELLSERVAKLEGSDLAMIGTVRDGQERTSARLATVETQNVFIMRQIDRVEATLARMIQRSN